MNRVLVFTLAASLGSAAMADTQFYWNGNTLSSFGNVSLSFYNGNSSPGGAFWVSSSSNVPGYGAGTNLFSTFCLENQIHMNLGVQYAASIDARAYSGGGGSSGDPISQVTEWIYDRWRAGNPSNWTQTQISQAIWYAEGETGGVNNAVYQAALAAGNSPANGAGHTYALNLWTLAWNADLGRWEGTDVQSQLISIVPVPGAVLLGAIGLGIVALAKRRMA